MYTLFKGSIKTRLDRSSHTVVTSWSLLSLGIWKTCLSFFLLSLWNGALLIRNVMGHLFSFLPRLVAVFYLFFNVGPCFADVLFEIKAYSLSLFLSLLSPAQKGQLLWKPQTESPVCLSSGITEDSTPPCKILPLPAFSRRPAEE